MAVIAAGFTALAPAPAMSAPPVASEATVEAEQTASEEAKRTGRRVEVTSKTTETDRTFANPNGSFTLETSAVPVRARTPSGWVPVDATLERRSDGTVAPRAAVVDMAFSGGGEGPFARIRNGGGALELTWPSALPEPVLDGSTATYREVLPDVDLVVTASPQSFSEVLVVRTAEAAANPKLRRITFGLRSRGVSVKTTPDGGLTAVDRHGIQMFTVPPASMWDSAAGSGGAAGAEGSRVGGPHEGDRVAPMRLEVDSRSLTVVPDETLLTGSGTRFPLYIDPVFSAAKNTWRMFNERYPNTSYVEWSGTEGLGYITDSYDGWHRKRLVFEFKTSSVNGAQIRSATFKAYSTHSYNCTQTSVQVYRVSGMSGTTTWNNQPSWVEYQDSTPVAAGRDGCYPNGAWIEWNATTGVRYATSHSYYTTALGMKAGSESTANTTWKRFRNDAVPSIDYNWVPPAPTGLRTTSPDTTCISGSNPPVIPNDPPILVARVEDKDGAKGQTVQAIFELWYKGGSAPIATYSTGFKLPGVDYTYQLPTLSDAHYSWRVRARDAANAYSVYSKWCDFRIDGMRPAVPTITTPEGQSYRYGSSASFTFGPGGSTDVTKYRYSFMSDAATSGEVPASDPNVTKTMWFFGPNKLRVWAYDAAGNTSDPPGSLEYTVAGERPRAQYRLDEGTGTTTADAIYGDTLTLSGGCTWTTGYWYAGDPTDKALSFNGTDGVAARSGGLLWMNQNYSVAAWMRVGDGSVRRDAVSQDGSGFNGSSFSVGVSPSGSAGTVNYEYRMRDPASATTEAVLSSPGPVGEWVHVTGVYESTTRLMTLYINGEFVTNYEAPFNGVEWTSKLVIGRGRSGTSPGHFWSGDVDEVRVFTGTLSPGQVYRIANEPRPAV